ncbi:MAG: hypothetical protein HS122_18610 [Opitutaceae bacterium]|nr:hypothetical protein [Opitutaceae bacterium]
MLIGIATESRTYIRIQPIIIVSFYALTVASITTHKIFDASFLLQLACRRFILIVIVSGIGYISDQLVRLVISEPFAFAITTAAILGFAYRLDSFLGSLFSPSFLYTRIREAVHLRREGGQDFETQIFQYETILREWSQSTCAQLGVICEDNQFRQNGFQLGKAELEELQRIHWATPERLSRERTSDRRGSLAKFLTKSAIAALVHVEGKTLQITIALGVRDSGRPYVHHEIEFLIDTAVQIEESLARSYLALKTKRAERLAILGILGAGIAHEIRNPLVAMKALVQLLPSKYAESQFRELFFPLMSGEIERIERLTEQLLDLASPRKYDIKSFPISDLIESSLPLIRYQADKDSVEIRLTESSSKICIDVDSSSFRQVFINLCLNAIQAQAQQSRHRWVEIEYTIRLGGAELVIKDNGPGIRPEARERLFETFNTTKSTGFGLGLALSSNILSDQGARLSVDPYLEGKGAVFRVFFPCKVQLD